MSELWTFNSLLPVLVVVPLVAALLSVLITARRLRAGISILFAALQVFIVVVLINHLTTAVGAIELRYALAGWGAPLGIELAADGFALLMLATTATLNFILSFYSAFYFTKPHVSARFWPLWWFLIAGLNGLFLAADAFNLYVTLEIIGLAAVALVALEGKREALVAALRYLLVGLLGSLCFLLAVALLYRSYGTLDLLQIAGMAEPTAASGAALVLISVGLLLKTALFPLHFWLPEAHANASAPVSAVLSALVVKASFYLLARFWLDVLAPVSTNYGLQLLGVLGALAVLVGSWRAWRAERLKLMVAYSTVAQLGYLFLLFPLAAGDGHHNLGDQHAKALALQAVAYFIVAHALAKAAMFLAAGNILQANGHDHINRLKGLARQQPLSVFTFAIAGISLMGLPPSAGFIAKWLLLNASIASQQWWWMLILLIGGLLAAAYIFRVLNLAFEPEDKHRASSTARVKLPLALPLCGFALALLAMLLGFNAQWILQLVDSPMQSLITAGGHL